MVYEFKYSNMLGELTETQIRNVLSSQVLGRIACADGEQPYIVPVTYVYDGEYIYGQTNEGEKLKILRKNPKLCFEADIMTDMANWQCVLVFGEFQELGEADAEIAKEILFNRIFSVMTSNTLHNHEHEAINTSHDDNRERKVMYRIKINKVSGRFERR